MSAGYTHTLTHTHERERERELERARESRMAQVKLMLVLLLSIYNNAKGITRPISMCSPLLRLLQRLGIVVVELLGVVAPVACGGSSWNCQRVVTALPEM